MRSNQTLKYFSFFISRFPDLTEKEKKVLLKRARGKTHDEIGKAFNLSEGRIRQIERTALSKVKSKTHQLALFKKMGVNIPRLKSRGLFML